MTDEIQAGSKASYPSLRGKRVIITGGGSGIGAGLVEAFVAQGAHVGFVDIGRADGQALAARLSGGAVRPPIFRQLDLTDLDALASVFSELIDEQGGCDILVNNAANDDRHAIEDVTAAYWDERMNVNLRHLFFAAQAVAPSMKAAGGGAILNFGSISWHLALDHLALYQTAKAAIEGLTRSLARDLGRSGIRCNVIVPGNVQTPRQQKWYTPEGEAEIVRAQCLDGRIQPSDVAALALFLASDDARLCTGHAYWIDAGWR
ncbi:SDR family NAD(P)-dependent oxidoreductase [Sphingomonas melonis]|uniref:NAD(P)-dependent dehydrogenase (Short-subunit alcohol dehydrogenase family) n=1 Tax=Sphingomonas melonis TaxID=152682 RepID=A0A7Y9FKW5_9SPHN|nr:SDR family oxidoreductase [Sphingomonas melonis]NYD89129.1 NAD(P)-dependent dehydrogenase (short-subunit alcohol dehydrogenase family) [Sphingomonas melonis]